jgi:AcrR family transcriptional regulator
MRKASVTDRRTRILDAAETAFADSGFAGASLRQIVLRAQVNLATVYYYFGSKKGLMEAVLKRRFGPLRQEALELLKQHEDEARGQPIPVERILEALLLPPLRLAATARTQHQAVMRLIGRIVTEPNAQTQQWLRSQNADVRSAFLEALRRSLPNTPLPDLRWRFEFVWGALAFTLCNPRKIEKETGGACDPLDTETVLSHMVSFFSAGLRAAPVSCRPDTTQPPRRHRT